MCLGIFTIQYFVSKSSDNIMHSLRVILILNVVLHGAITYLFTELISHFGLFSIKAIFGFWIMMCLAQIAFIFLKKVPLKINYNSSFLEHKGILGVIGIFSLIALFTALAYPPMTADSYTYHLARIVRWFQHGSLDHYASFIDRQLFQPPFAEVLIAHTMGLSGNDILANSLQWGCMLGAAICISLILRFLDFSRLFQLVGALLVILTPSVYLEASSTQNDLVLGFYVSALYFFVIWKMRRKEGFSFLDIMISICLASAVLTKGTGYVYCFAPMACYGLYQLMLYIKKTISIPDLAKSYGIVLVVFLIFNISHFTRNIEIYDHPLSSERMNQHLSNKEMNVPLAISNITKNVAIHFSYPPIIPFVTKVVEGVHSVVGVNSDDQRITIGGRTFMLLGVPNHESKGSNIFQALLIIAAYIVFLISIFRKEKYRVEWYFMFGTVLFSFIFFALYLKWQPVHSRLHVPLLILAVPSIVYLIDRMYRNNVGRILTYIFSAGILINGLYVTFMNNSRPLVVVKDHTMGKKLFMTPNNYLYSTPKRKGYDEVRRFLQKESIDRKINVGCIFMEKTWEYPLTYDFYKNKNLSFHHIMLTKRSPSLKLEKPVDADFIIVDSRIEQYKDPILMYGDKKFRKINTKHSIFWIYKRVGK